MEVLSSPIKTKYQQAKADMKRHHLHLVWQTDEGVLDASAVWGCGEGKVFAHQCYKHRVKMMTSTVLMNQESGLEIGADALDHTWGCFTSMSHMCFCFLTPSFQMLDACCVVLHEVVMGHETLWCSGRCLQMMTLVRPVGVYWLLFTMIVYFCQN